MNHVHLVGDKPLCGTSTVVSEAFPKPALIYWALQVGLAKFGFLPPKKKIAGKYVTITSEERLQSVDKVIKTGIFGTAKGVLGLLDEAYTAHNTVKKEAAVGGTDMHSLLEEYVKDCISKNGGKPIKYTGANEKVKMFANWSEKEIQQFIHSEVNMFSEKYWLGGITDVVAKMTDGKYSIIDFKSSKESYLSQFLQAALYDLQQAENGFYTADGKKVGESLKIEKYIVIPFGKIAFEPDTRVDIANLQKTAVALLVVYNAINNDSNF